jgi:hypothetical protein
MWQQGLDDEQIAGQLTQEGFHSARSPQVPRKTVMKIRLEHGWHLPRWQIRNVLELDGHLTARGLAKRLSADRSWVYRRIYDGTIDPDYVTRHPQSKVYLIKDEPEMIARLRQHLRKNKRT